MEEQYKDLYGNLKFEFADLARAFIFALDCQLATVESLAPQKSKSKSEYKRHLEISKKLILDYRSFDAERFDKSSRAIWYGGSFKSAKDCNWDVYEWAKQFEV